MPLWAVLALTLFALAVFTGFEAALTSLSRLRLRHWVGQQISGGADPALLERPQRLLTMAFVGANLSKVALGMAAAHLVHRRLADPLDSPLVAVVVVVAAMTPPAVLLGEVLPRAVVHEAARRLLPTLFYGGRFLALLFWPYIALMDLTAAALFRLLGVPRPPRERLFTRASIEALLTEGEREGLVERREREIIGEIFSFGETPVREVMTPRTDVVTVRLGSSRRALAQRIWETGFSRFPVVDGAPDNVVGIIHAVDVLKARDGERLRLRPTLFVPETTTCDELLYDMRRQRIQLAVVLDEYGGLAGIVTMEDLVEELVGEIRDEHDEGASVSAAEGGGPGGDAGGGVVLDARARLSEVARLVPLTIPAGREDPSLAAYLLERLGRVPAPGERVALENLELEVVEATPRRIVRVRVRSGQGADGSGARGTVSDG